MLSCLPCPALPCLAFPTKTPIKLSDLAFPLLLLLPDQNWSVLIFPFNGIDVSVLTSHVHMLKSHGYNFNTGVSMDYSAQFRAHLKGFFNELDHIHIRLVHDLNRRLKQSRSSWTGGPSAVTIEENHFSGEEIGIWYSCVINDIGLQKSVFSHASRSV